jgi:nucleoside-diphosphate-sugar epimerase
MNKKKILVTGGTGFIGSHLCESLGLKPTRYIAKYIKASRLQNWK